MRTNICVVKLSEKELFDFLEFTGLEPLILFIKSFSVFKYTFSTKSLQLKCKRQHFTEQTFSFV